MLRLVSYFDCVVSGLYVRGSSRCCGLFVAVWCARHSIKMRLSKQKGRSCVVSLLQRLLPPTQGCFPATAGSAQFCLLCCQPEPVPESLPARPPSLTRRCPCSLPVWLGQPIHMVHRTYSSPQHSASHTPTWGTERCDPPQIQIWIWWSTCG